MHSIPRQSDALVHFRVSSVDRRLNRVPSVFFFLCFSRPVLSKQDNKHPDSQLANCSKSPRKLKARSETRSKRHAYPTICKYEDIGKYCTVHRHRVRTRLTGNSKRVSPNDGGKNLWSTSYSQKEIWNGPYAQNN